LLKDQHNEHYPKIQDLKVCFLKLNEYNVSMVEKMDSLVRHKYELNKVIEERIKKMNQDDHILFILDGYDEYGGKESFS
jgi:hypothetical protein